MGLEPTTSTLLVRRATHSATLPLMFQCRVCSAMSDFNIYHVFYIYRLQYEARNKRKAEKEIKIYESLQRQKSEQNGSEKAAAK